MFSKLKSDPDHPICPLVQQPCLKHGCTFYAQLLGRNPQTGQEIDRWGCTIAMLPMLLIEAANETRKTAAAVDQCRQEIAETSEQARDVTVETSKAFLRTSKDLILTLSAAMTQKALLEAK